MLGCHDFCGYYEWTFHYVRRRWGQDAFWLLMREAIGEDCQQHYAGAGAESVLRKLYNSWVKTGQDEHCNWTWTLDEEKNVLRCDMRECPSKGFLIENDLQADEDYCNHCAGWIVPMLEGLGGEIVEHEHNHCGQCWFALRMKDRPAEALSLEIDVRRDPRWKRGYIDRWERNEPLAILPEVSPSSDPCEALEAWFRRLDAPVLVDDATYNRGIEGHAPAGVLIGCPPADLVATAVRYHAATPAERPLLLHAFLPGVPFVDFLSTGLPRPMPILPLLIRCGLYTHRSGGPHPATAEFLRLLTAALGK